MILLFTDFGSNDLYAGQVKAVLHQYAPNVPVIDLLHDIPSFNVKAGAHLLAALSQRFQAGDVFFAVVDPGVGGKRDPIVMLADGQWYVGPDNGLLSVVAARAHEARLWRIIWQPQKLSQTFHGRDLFAPIAALLAKGENATDRLEEIFVLQNEFGRDDLAEIIYFDHYGNAITGMRANTIPHHSCIRIGSHKLALAHAPTFSAVGPEQALWYENSLGLVEIAVNGGSAAGKLKLEVGQPVQVIA